MLVRTVDDVRNRHKNNGFNSSGIHKETGTKYGPDGYNAKGYNELGQDKYGNQVATMLSGDASLWAYKNVENYRTAFSINVSRFDTSGVTNMAGMFLGCTNVLDLDLSNFDTSNVTNMESMFAACTSLRSIRLGGPVWKHLDDKDVFGSVEVFGSYSSVREIQVPYYQLDEYMDRYRNDPFSEIGSYAIINPYFP